MGNTTTTSFSQNKKELLKLLLEERQQQSCLPTLNARDWSGPRPLSFAQQRLWFLDQWQPGNVNYSIPVLIRLSGELDVGALEQSFAEILRRHETLRASFVLEEGNPKQIVADPLPFSMLTTDLSGLGLEQAEAEAKRLAVAQLQTPFDLTQGPLFRAALYRISATEHRLALTFHHIVTDAWSFGILFHELSACYAAFSKREQPNLQPLPIQYADFAQYQRELFETAALRKQLSYWRERLSGPLPLLDLPTDHPQPMLQTFAGAQSRHIFSRETSEKIRRFARQQNATLFMALLAGFKLLVHRYSNQEDIIVGTPVAGRTRMETETLIGFFINTLALRTQVDGNISFRTLLDRMKETSLDAFANQEVPFEKLVEELHVKRDLSRPPIFQVMFSLQNAPVREISLPGLKLNVTRLDNSTSKFDITLDAFDREEGISCLVEYNTDLFELPTIERMVRSLEKLLEAAVQTPDEAIGRLPLLGRRSGGRWWRSGTKPKAHSPRPSAFTN